MTKLQIHTRKGTPVRSLVLAPQSDSFNAAPTNHNNTAAGGVGDLDGDGDCDRWFESGPLGCIC